MRQLYFFSTHQIPDSAIIDAIKAHPGFFIGGEFLITVNERGGEFPYVHEVLTPQIATENAGQVVSFLNSLLESLSTTLGISASFLIDDEGSNPYQFIHLRARVEPISIFVRPEEYDDRDELVVESFYRPVWGMFALPVYLTSDQELFIASELNKTFSKIENDIHGFEAVPIDLDLISSDFRNLQIKDPDLMPFRYFYSMWFAEGTPWRSKEDIVMCVMTAFQNFQRHTNLAVCIFPLDGVVVENIPGGSDSECHCVIINGNETRRFVYKQRRKTWLHKP